MRLKIFSIFPGPIFLGMAFGLFLVGGLSTGHAVEKDALKRLIAAKTIQCLWGPGSARDWTSDEPTIQRLWWGRGGLMTYDVINLKAGTARLIAAAGVANVQVFRTASSLHFTQQSAQGDLSFTTIFPELAHGEYIAVYSRHIVNKKPYPNQYHGTCKIIG